jgi:hypothetical protein
VPGSFDATRVSGVELGQQLLLVFVFLALLLLLFVFGRLARGLRVFGSLRFLLFYLLCILLYLFSLFHVRNVLAFFMCRLAFVFGCCDFLCLLRALTSLLLFGILLLVLLLVFILFCASHFEAIG